MTSKIAERRREQYHGCPIFFQLWTDPDSFALGRHESITATAEPEAITALTVDAGQVTL